MKELMRIVVRDEVITDYLYSLMYTADANLFLIKYLMEEKSSIKNNQCLSQFKKEYMESRKELNVAMEELKQELIPTEILKQCTRVDFQYATKELIAYGG